MSGRNLLIIVLAVLVMSAARFTEVRAAGECTELLTGTCLECHTSDRFCETLGGTKQKWRGLLDYMIENGAELNDEQIGLLIGCLSGPSEEAKKVCGK